MDQWLANIYGTGGGDDLEKTAQNMLLQKLAEDEGVDLSGLSEEQLQALANEVLNDEEQADQEQQEQQEQQELTPEETEEYLAKEAQAKFEEADFLGRVMAHSYTQELEKIARIRDIPAKALSKFKSLGKKVDTGAQRLGKKVFKGVARTHGEEEAMSPRTARAIGYGTAGGSTATVGGGAYSAKKHFEKDASAFEKLAEMRAAEILQANGIDPSTGAPAEQQQQEAPDEQFGQALDNRALEILQANGYDVSGLAGE